MKEMKKSELFNAGRRRFLAQIPCAAAVCLGCSQAWAQANESEPTTPAADLHKFQTETPSLTYYQWMKNRHEKYIGILKRLKEPIGQTRLLELLKEASYAENVELGKKFSARIDSMNSFAGPFRNPDSRVGQTIVREIIEDNDKVFEMKITECLTEQIFREAGARDLGFACVCHADYGLPEGMDLGIKLVRSKTLMEGHDCCNHRYVLEG